MKNPALNLLDVSSKVLKIISKSNEIAKDAFSKEIAIEWKREHKYSNAILTKTDKILDDYLRDKLSKISPEIGFITEENKKKVKRLNWIIDPIDGTNNFAHNIPLFGTMIALWE